GRDAQLAALEDDRDGRFGRADALGEQAALHEGLAERLDLVDVLRDLNGVRAAVRDGELRRSVGLGHAALLLNPSSHLSKSSCARMLFCRMSASAKSSA